MREYNPPKIPTFAEAREDSTLLKRMPRRWKRNTAILACAGIVGTVSLAGCDDFRPHHGGSGAAIYVTQSTEQEVVPFVPHEVLREELERRLHSGGSGSAVYVVYFTEQEALGMIRARLEEAGLRFGESVPEYSYPNGDEMWGALDKLNLDLFDSGRNVAITLMNSQESYPGFSPPPHELAEYVAEDFINHTSLDHVGVFYTQHAWAEEENPRPQLEANLEEQIDAFVEQLKQQGVL